MSCWFEENCLILAVDRAADAVIGEALLAQAVGVRIAPGPRFGPDGTMESFVRLPFTVPPEQLVTAMRRLASIAGRAAAGSRTGLPGWVA